MIISAPPYEAMPLISSNFNEATVMKVHKLINTIIKHESFFTDFMKACDDDCGICPQCQAAKQIVTANLHDRKSLSWEVWRQDEETGELLDFVGILRLSNVLAGCDATAHYFFFDGKLHDKTRLLMSWAEWLFENHDSWPGLHRLTVEIPTHAFALARHAAKRLNFGGPYEYRLDSTRIPVEGVKKAAVLWKGGWHDLLIMGLINDGRNLGLHQ